MIMLCRLNNQCLPGANSHFIFPLTLQPSCTVGFLIQLLANRSATLPHSQLFTINTSPTIHMYSLQFNSEWLGLFRFNSFCHTVVLVLILASSFSSVSISVSGWEKHTWEIDLKIESTIHLSFLWRIDVYSCARLLAISSFPYISYLRHWHSFSFSLVLLIFITSRSVPFLWSTQWTLYADF